MAKRSWAPGGDRARWQRRAELFAYLRQFFGERGVLEVDTPVLGRLGATVNISTPAMPAPIAAEVARKILTQGSTSEKARKLVSA